jgi:hypothetical protein
LKYFLVYNSILTQNKEIKQIKMMPLIPAVVVKYIATFLNYRGIQDVEMIIRLFKAFTLGIEYDDRSTRDYKENVQLYLSVLMYDSLDEWYGLSDKPFPYELSPLDLAWVYEVTFAHHYSQSCRDNPETFLKISELLERYTTLCDNETIMGDVSYPMNIKDLKFISLLEKALIMKKGELIRFICENMMYDPIMAFYLYVKHNHVDYRRTEENSLANDEVLLDLLQGGGYQKELLSLAISGLFNNEFIYTNKHSESQIIERHMVMPNPEVVKEIINKFPGIRKELIPFYMKSRIEIELDENYGEEGPSEILPFDNWQQYKNTFEERIFVDRSNDVYSMQTITIPKNEAIGILLHQ